MILEKKPIPLVQVKEYLKNAEETSKPLADYIKSFTKTSKDDAKKIDEGLRSLRNLKINDENIVKLIDLLPEDVEDINKIFHDVNLTEEESNAILSVVKK